MITVRWKYDIAKSRHTMVGRDIVLHRAHENAERNVRGFVSRKSLFDVMCAMADVLVALPEDTRESSDSVIPGLLQRAQSYGWTQIGNNTELEATV